MTALRLVEESITTEIRRTFDLSNKESQNMVDAIVNAKSMIIGIYSSTVTVTA